MTTPNTTRTGLPGASSALRENDAQTAQRKYMQALINRFHAARKQRRNWEKLWQECYDYTLPQRGSFLRGIEQGGGAKRSSRIFDSTAMDAVDQLAASLLGNLTPIWSQWFGLKPGPDLSAEESARLAPILEKAARTIQDHFDRSNFAVEIHQCYLDLIVGGTASLYFEEAEPGGFSAFRFASVPLSHAIFEESETGFLEATFRTMDMTLDQIQGRYKLADIPLKLVRSAERDPQSRFKVLESVSPDGLIYTYNACLIEDEANPVMLASGRFDHAPFINFRWLKSPGEIYGRSPL